MSFWQPSPRVGLFSKLHKMFTLKIWPTNWTCYLPLMCHPCNYAIAWKIMDVQSRTPLEMKDLELNGLNTSYVGTLPSTIVATLPQVVASKH